MKSRLALPIPLLPQPIRYTDKVLLIGSCFTEHIAAKLQQHKFNVLGNPHGILFNTLSVTNSLKAYASGRRYNPSDLFYLNELWNSWDFHSRFSDIDRDTALLAMNQSREQASNFLKEADWIIITLGSAFYYALTEQGRQASGIALDFVANNHRAPASWFQKTLSPVADLVETLESTLSVISQINPRVKFLFTISPVRHIRDGLVENSRSKARLIEAVHSICDHRRDSFYFPAYELLIDVLRDYRYYDVDMVHPNFAATAEVWEAFVASCLDPSLLPIMEQVKEITTARLHRPRFPQTAAHRQFMERNAEKVKALLQAHPYLDLKEEWDYFSSVATIMPEAK
ncbi:MAG: GSCFA domain-containing protein [Bacteroidetes bacterium]|nr:GSCFA domain-containing protein [Bacteroidota bacterium]